MHNRDDVDGSQRPVTADAPEPATDAEGDGRLGPGGDPAEGTPAQQQREVVGGPGVADHLKEGGDPAEGKPVADGSSAD